MNTVVKGISVASLALVSIALSAWGALAIYYSDLQSELLRTSLAVVFGLFGLLALFAFVPACGAGPPHKQYELIYMVGDERDLIGLRTNYRKAPPEDVYLYRVRAPLENMRRFFMDYIRAINSLKEQPEFYNTLTTNCTTNVIDTHPGQSRTSALFVEGAVITPVMQPVGALQERAKTAAMNKAAWTDWLNKQWEQFDSKFSLLFGVLFILVISVITDWLQNATTDKYPLHGHPLLIAISHGSLLVGLLLFVILLSYYLKSVSADLRHFKDEMQICQDALHPRAEGLEPKGD